MQSCFFLEHGISAQDIFEILAVGKWAANGVGQAYANASAQVISTERVETATISSRGYDAPWWCVLVITLQQVPMEFAGEGIGANHA
jgi:hypothetical protein